MHWEQDLVYTKCILIGNLTVEQYCVCRDFSQCLTVTVTISPITLNLLDNFGLERDSCVLIPPPQLFMTGSVITDTWN